MLKQLHAAPNLLTFLRLFIVPFLLLAVLDARYRVALGLFVAAGLTDALDGLAARLLRQQTPLGQYLDPVADKLLLSTLFLVFTYQHLIPLRVTVLVFSRDLGILVVACLLYITLGTREFQPSILGKASTFVQIIALISVMVCQFYGSSPLRLLRSVMLKATALLAILSAMHYAWRTAHHRPSAANSRAG